MFIRQRSKANTVSWGNGTSSRLLVEADNVGYTVCHTVVQAGTTSQLEYRNHLESCYCISGRGRVQERDGSVHVIEPGTLYVLDKNDPHLLIADAGEDLHLMSVFAPALRGDEVHRLDGSGYSAY